MRLQGVVSVLLFSIVLSPSDGLAVAQFSSQGYIRKNFEQCQKILGPERSAPVTKLWRRLADDMRGATEENLHPEQRQDYESRAFAMLAECERLIEHHLLESNSVDPSRKKNPLVMLLEILPKTLTGLRWVIGGDLEKQKIISEAISREADKLDNLKEAFGDHSREVIANTSKKIATEVFFLTKGEVPRDDFVIKIATKAFVQEAVRFNLRSFGVSESDVGGIVQRSTASLIQCLDGVEARYSDKDLRIKGYGECSARFAAAKEYRVAQSLLENELNRKLSSYLEASSVQKILTLSKGVLAQCAAKVVAPLDLDKQSAARIRGIKGCTYLASLATFQLSSREVLRNKILNFSTQPHSVIQLSHEQIEKMIADVQNKFINSPDSREALSLCPGLRRNFLNFIHDVESSEMFQALSECDAESFTRAAGVWLTEFSEIAGREAVGVALDTHPKIVEFLDGKTLSAESKSKILTYGYDPCVRRLRSNNVELDPEKCMGSIEFAAKLELGSKSIHEAFREKFDTLIAKENDRFLENHFQLIHAEAVQTSDGKFKECFSKTFESDFNRLPLEAQNSAALRCLEPLLNSHIEKLVEAQLLQIVNANKSFKEYLPKDSKALVKKLSDQGILKSASDFAKACFLKNANSYRVENLKSLLEAREPICAFYLEQRLSLPISQLVAEGVASASLVGATESVVREAQQTLRDVAKEHYSSGSGGPYVPEVEHGQVSALLDTNFGKGFQWHRDPSEELSSLEESKKAAQLAIQIRKDGWRHSQSLLTYELMKVAAEQTMDHQMSKLFSPSEAEQRATIKEKIFLKVGALVDNLTKKSAELAALSSGTLKHEQRAAELMLLEKSFVGDVAHTATSEIMPYKLRQSLEGKVSTDHANASVDSAMEVYSRCILREEKSSTYGAESVTVCSNHGVAAGMWAAYRAGVDDSLSTLFGAEHARVKSRAVSDLKCGKTNPKGVFEDRYIHLLCQENSFKSCVSSPLHLPDRATPPASEARVHTCMANYLIDGVGSFAPLAILSELEKVMLVQDLKVTDPKIAALPENIWHEKMKVLGKKHLEALNVEDNINQCMEDIKSGMVKGNVPPTIASAEAHTNACVSLQVFNSSRVAGSFAFMQFLFLEEPSLAAKSPQELEKMFLELKNPSSLEGVGSVQREVLKKYHQCLDQKERDYFGLTVREVSLEVARQISINKKINPDQTKKATSECSKILESNIRAMVFRSLESNAAEAAKLIDDIGKNFRTPQDRAAAMLRVEAGHKAIAEAAKLIDDKTQGHALPAIPKLKDNLDQLSEMSVRACIYSVNCEAKLMDFRHQLQKISNNETAVTQDDFEDKLLDSEFFDLVIMGNIQKQMRSSLESELSPRVTGLDRYSVIQMINHLTSFEYLNSRFLDSNPRDRNNSKVASGRYIVNHLKKYIKNQMKSNGKFDPKDPKFVKMAADLVEDYLHDDWEFNAAIFWSLAGGGVDAHVPGTGVYFFTDFDKNKDMDWWLKVSRTQAGCQIIKEVQAIMKAQSSGKSLVLDKKRFGNLYEKAIKEGRSGQNLDPSKCLHSRRPVRDLPAIGEGGH